MSKFRFITLSIFVLFLSFTKLSSTPGNLGSSPEKYLGPNDLSKKKYYEEIFTKSERKQLKKAIKYLVAGKKYMVKYDRYRKEIGRNVDIVGSTNSEKTRRKAQKKIRKLEEKAFKAGFKALEYYKKGTDLQNKIYTTSINRNRLNDNSENAKLGRKIELEAKTIWESAKTQERMAPQHDKQQKFNALREANSLILKSLKMQETAFEFYKNDPSANPELYNIEENNNQVDTIKQLINQDSVLFPVYAEHYNPSTDPNLYRSKANLILPRLNLNSNELKVIVDANKKNQFANNLLKQVDEAYIKVDSLNHVADQIEDFQTRDKVRTQAIEKENSAFYKLINATNVYIDVNETRYKIYKKHFPKIDEGKRTEKTNRAKRYEQEADDYYAKAKNDIAKANRLMYKSEQYLKLMGANDMLLFALQLQESAYGIYFDLPQAISPDIDTSFIADNTINESIVSTPKENTSSSLSWEFLSRYTYSKEKPKPVRYKKKSGVVFLVQVGIFKGLLPPARFGTVQPLVFDKFVKNPYRRYLVGEYRTHEAAQLALSKVKALGYSDAYILSLVNGNRKSLSFGQAKVTNDDHYAHLKRMEIAKIKGEKNTYTPPVNDSYTGSNVSKTKGLLYFVQLGTYNTPKSSADFKNLQPIFTHKTNKGTRYMLGKFGTMAAARNESSRVKNMGIKDAYVTAYYNGGHISLDRAKKLEKQQHGTVYSNNNNNVTTNNYSPGVIKFMVQVGAYSQTLSSADENKLHSKFAPRNIDRKFAGGMNVYTIGNYSTYNEANYLKKKLIGEGHSGVFVVAFEGNKKISVGDAIKKSK